MPNLLDTLPEKYLPTAEAKRQVSQASEFIQNQSAYARELSEIKNSNIALIKNKEATAESIEQELNKQKAFAEKMRGVQTSLTAIRQAGIQFKDKRVADFATAGQAASELYASGATFNMQTLSHFCSALAANSSSKHLGNIATAGFGATQIFTSASSLMGPAGLTGAAALGPIGLIGIGALSLISAFKKKKQAQGENPFPLLFQHLQVVIQGIQEVLSTVREMRYENILLHQMTLDAVQKGFSRMEEIGLSTLSEIHDFRKMAATAFHDLNNTMNYWGTLSSHEHKILALGEYRKLLSRMHHWIDEDEKDHPAEKIPQLLNQAVDWLGTNHEDSLYARTSSPLFTGINLLQGLSSQDDLYRLINDKVLPMVTEETVAEKRAFLAYYARSISAPVRHPITHEIIAHDEIVDPTLWAPLAMTYTEFRDQFNEYVLDRDQHNLDRIIKTGENNLSYLQALQNNSELFAKLFRIYQQTYQEIQQIIPVEIANQNNAINNRVDIRSDMDTLIAACAGSYPVSQVVSGNNAAYTYYGRNLGNLQAWAPHYPGGLPEMVNLYVQNGNDYALGLIVAYTGVATDFQYNSGVVRPHVFPPEFLVLEKLGRGIIASSYVSTFPKPWGIQERYNIVYSGSSQNYTRSISVRFNYHSGLSRQIVQFDQNITNGDVVSQQMNVAQDNVAEARTHLSDYILGLRKAAIQQVILKAEALYHKLDASRRLLLAYGMDAGFPEELCTLLKTLDSSDNLRQRFNDYLIASDISTPMPSLNTNISPIEQPVLALLCANDPSKFKGDATNKFNIVLSELQTLKADEPVKQAVREALVVEARIEEKAEAARQAAHKAAEESKLHREREDKQEIESYHQGLNIGKSFAISFVISALEDDARFVKAASLLRAKFPSTIASITIDSIPPSLKHGLMQSISIAVVDAISALTTEREMGAISYLGDFLKDFVSLVAEPQARITGDVPDRFLSSFFSNRNRRLGHQDTKPLQPHNSGIRPE